MNTVPLRVGIPISTVRLIGAAVTGAGFGLLFYSARANQSWVALAVYLFLGVTIGAVLGWYEAKTVLSRIKTDPVIIQWKLVLAVAGLVIFPFVIISGLYGFLESRNFLGYTVLTAIPAFLELAVLNTPITKNKTECKLSAVLMGLGIGLNQSGNTTINSIIF